MRRTLRTAITLAAALVAAALLYLGLTLPPRTVALDGRPPATHVVGAYHLHTVRSDGTGTVDEVAAAAARTGLQFLVFTDHGDGTRVPDPPTYRHGVLCIDAVEISSRDGHIVALGLPGATPYPFGGPGRDVIEDIHRLGGAAIVAHPGSPKPALRWRGSNLPFDGIEWLNADSEWRDEAPIHLAASAVRALFRPPEVIATLFSRPVRNLRRWDAAARQRPVFGLAALDAHASIGWREDEEPRAGAALAQPSYATMFRTLVQTVVLHAPLTGDATTDGARLLAAIRAGRSYSVLRAFAWPVFLQFEATQGGRTLEMGDRVAESAGAVDFDAEVPGAPGTRVALMQDGRPVTAGQGSIRLRAVTAPGVYRVEVMFPGQTVPWIVSNPITIAPPSPPAPRGPNRVPDVTNQGGAASTLSVDDLTWHVERDPTSEGTLTRQAGRAQFTYQLGGGEPHDQYAAVAIPLGADVGIDRISFVARAERPMRLSVQVRLPGSRGDRRWRQSVYVDETARPIHLWLQDFEPVTGATTRRPVVAPLQALLFVVDTINARPGTSGTVWISDLTLGVSHPGG